MTSDRARSLAALPLALLLAACVSTRPWRDCPRPCPDGEIAHSQEVRVVSYDDHMLVIDHPRPDPHGHFIAGGAHAGAATSAGSHLRRRGADRDAARGAGRVAANVVLVPLAVTAAAFATYYGRRDGRRLAIDPQSGSGCPVRPPAIDTSGAAGAAAGR